MKQTAVEWLKNELNERCDIIGNESSITDILDQAKKMEKEQIIEAFEAAEKDCGRDFLHGDLYYNEIFKSE